MENAYSAETPFIFDGISHSVLKEFNKDPALHPPTAAVRNGVALSFAFKPGTGGSIQSILKLKASTLGSSFLPSTPGVLGDGRHGALFLGLDSFINQREIAAGEGGGRSMSL